MVRSTCSWLGCLLVLLLSTGARGQIFAITQEGNGGTGPIAGLECVWKSCYGATLADPGGVSGCKHHSLLNMCTGTCVFCDGTTTVYTCEVKDSTCDPSAGTIASCGFKIYSVCYYSTSVPPSFRPCLCQLSDTTPSNEACNVPQCQ